MFALFRTNNIFAQLSIAQKSGAVSEYTGWLYNRTGLFLGDSIQPSSMLDVMGQITLRGGNPGLNKILVSNANGLAKWQSLTSGFGISITDSTITNSAPDQTVILNSGSGTNITGIYPNFTINNSQPDQIVNLTGSGATSVTGTYPNFTISSTDNNNTYTGGTGISISGNTINSVWTKNNNDIYNNNSGNVGVGIQTPQNILHLHENPQHNGLISLSAFYGLQITNSVTQATSTDGLLIGVNGYKNATINLLENANLLIGTNNKDYLTILSDGKFMFGETGTPTAHVNIFSPTTQTGGLLITKDGTGYALQAIVNNTHTTPLILKNGTNTLMTVLGNGRVGIGTDSPDCKLLIADNLPIAVKAISTSASPVTYWAANSIFSYGLMVDAQGKGAIVKNINAAQPEKIISFDNGQVKIENLPLNNSPVNVVVDDGNGNIGKKDISALGDNLGNHIATQNITLGDHAIFLRGTGDFNHGLKFTTNFGGFQNLDGPVIFGYSTGVLGTTYGGEKLALYWNNSGNVGIGIANPGSKLYVQGGQLKVNEAETGAGELRVGAAWGYPGIYGESATKPLVLGSATNNIYMNGNVGIGTEPNYKLHIKGTTENETLLYLEPAVWATHKYAQLTIGDANHYIRSIFGDGMLFHDVNQFVFEGGNVGIGTNSPVAKLQITSSSNNGEQPPSIRLEQTEQITDEEHDPPDYTDFTNWDISNGNGALFFKNNNYQSQGFTTRLTITN